jgi:hypothetical protein
MISKKTSNVIITNPVTTKRAVVPAGESIRSPISSFSSKRLYVSALNEIRTQTFMNSTMILRITVHKNLYFGTMPMHQLHPAQFPTSFMN